MDDQISAVLNMPGPFGDGIREAQERKAAFIAQYGEEAWRRRLEERTKRDMFELDRKKEEERSLLRLKSSGFGESIEEVKEYLSKNSFDSFNAVESWQKEMQEICQRFIQQDNARFMYLSGQPGCGKTHLGSAISAQYLKTGKSTRYAVHGLLMTEMKANVNEDEAYYKLLNEYGNCAVLYLDDFLKPIKDQFTGAIKPPTAADIDHSFKLINKRYVRGGITIITSERSINEIIELDEALGSRIKQRCGDFVLHVTKKPDRNYRMRSIQDAH